MTLIRSRPSDTGEGAGATRALEVLQTHANLGCLGMNWDEPGGGRGGIAGIAVIADIARDPVIESKSLRRFRNALWLT